MAPLSLKIDIDDVIGVLLHDGWHAVAENSFDLDSYEFVDDGETVHGGGESGITATGFQFKSDKGRLIAGPLTAIIAVSRSA